MSKLNQKLEQNQKLNPRQIIEANLMQLNLMETYSVLTILKNLGLEDKYKRIAGRMLL